jgi:hypothetical protein
VVSRNLLVIADLRARRAEEIVEAEIVEPANDTPPRVAEMIKNGAFDRKPSQ